MLIDWQNLRVWFREYFRANPKAKWITIGVVALVLLSVCVNVFAQVTEPTLVYRVTPTEAEGSVAAVVEWRVDNAREGTACTASGHASWSGTKPVSGTLTLPTITATATPVVTNLRIVCIVPAVPGDNDAELSWTAPTQNTDGSALTNLSGYRVHWGTSATALTESVQIPNPSTVRYTVENLPDGAQYFFGVRAYTPSATSELSNLATWSPSPGLPAVTLDRTVTLTVRPPKIPNPPTQLQVVSQAAWSVDLEISRRQVVFRLDREIGTVPMGTPCRKDFRVAGTNFYRVDAHAVTFNSRRDRTFLVVASCASRPINVEVG